MPRTHGHSAVRRAGIGVVKKTAANDRELLDALSAYDPADVRAFARLLRKSMDRIEGHEKLARMMGKSVATLHRWADPRTPIGGTSAASPIERAAIVSLLRIVIIHGVDYTEARLPSVLASIVNGVDVSLGRKIDPQLTRKKHLSLPARTAKRPKTGASAKSSKTVRAAKPRRSGQTRQRSI